MRNHVIFALILLAVNVVLFVSHVFADVHVEGGVLEINGQLKARCLTVSPSGILRGSGSIDADSAIEGVVSPGNGPVSDTSTLSFKTTVVFHAGSSYQCYAASHTSLDKIAAGGMVSGACQVVMTRAGAAIPLGQVILDGGGGSDYTAFSLRNSTNWLLREQAVGDLIVTETTGDSDGDTLPDYWENDYYGSRTNADVSADTDGDDHSSWEEFIAGTVPTNGNSVLAIVSNNVVASSNMVVQWTSVDGKQYALLWATNLLNEFAVVSSNIAATAPENVYTDVIQNVSIFFYQVRVNQ